VHLYNENHLCYHIEHAGPHFTLVLLRRNYCMSSDEKISVHMFVLSSWHFKPMVVSG